MFLPEEDLVALTGYKKSSSQIQWLQDNNWPFAVAGDGKPRVLRDLVIARLGDTTKKTSSEPKLHFRNGP